MMASTRAGPEGNKPVHVSPRLAHTIDTMPMVSGHVGGSSISEFV